MAAHPPREQQAPAGLQTPQHSSEVATLSSHWHVSGSPLRAYHHESFVRAP
jgi:hypothetical protein